MERNGTENEKAWQSRWMKKRNRVAFYSTNNTPDCRIDFKLKHVAFYSI